jgi:hypothetical protein
MPPAERSEQPGAEKRRGYDEEDLEWHGLDVTKVKRVTLLQKEFAAAPI